MSLTLWSGETLDSRLCTVVTLTPATLVGLRERERRVSVCVTVSVPYTHRLERGNTSYRVRPASVRRPGLAGRTASSRARGFYTRPPRDAREAVTGERGVCEKRAGRGVRGSQWPRKVVVS